MIGAAQLARAIAAGERSARAAVQASLDRIEALNGGLNALTVVLAEDALAAADRADARLALGEPPPPLLGVPFTVKENIDVAGTVTSFGRGLARARRAARGARAAIRWARQHRHGAAPTTRAVATVNPFDAGSSPGGAAAATRLRWPPAWRRSRSARLRRLPARAGGAGRRPRAALDAGPRPAGVRDAAVHVAH
jgi:amidase